MIKANYVTVVRQEPRLTLPPRLRRDQHPGQKACELIPCFTSSIPYKAIQRERERSWKNFISDKYERNSRL